jgi:hypothetical protein
VAAWGGSGGSFRSRAFRKPATGTEQYRLASCSDGQEPSIPVSNGQ